MRKIVINKCFGGFGLSPQATLWLWEKGYRGDEADKFKQFATPAEEYFGGPYVERDDSLMGYKRALTNWREYLAKGSNKGERDPLFLTIFTPDEKFVLSGNRDVQRDHPLVVECIETLGDKANGSCADLQIREIPEDVKWFIDEYDGLESIHEEHRSWD